MYMYTVHVVVNCRIMEVKLHIHVHTCICMASSQKEKTRILPFSKS